MSYSIAISVLKKEISRLMGRHVEITEQVAPLLLEKEEIEAMAREIEESIKKLGEL